MTSTTTAPAVRFWLRGGTTATVGSSWTATFTGPDAERAAVAYHARYAPTHAIDLDGDDAEAALDAYPALYEAMFPTCDHGLSLRLCAGPGHYPADY